MTLPKTVRTRALAVSLSLALCAATGSALAAPTPAGPPRGIHLSFTGDSRTTATVTWLTDGSTDPGAAVEYGTTEDLGSTLDASTEAVPRVDALVHTATITGLQPGETVHYRVTGSSGSSPIRSFHTAPAGDSFRFAVFADHGTNAQSAKTPLAVLESQPDLALMAGDLSYANGRDPVWDTWLGILEPLASRVPVMTVPGNHEYENYPKLWSSYTSRMAMPNNELWYGFDYANVHFLLLQSEAPAHTQAGTLDDMLLYAEQDLAAAAERRAAGEIDHIIVIQHHPLYGNQQGGADRQRNPYWIPLEERLLHAYDVDMLITGHNHHYERSKPMVYGVPTTTETASHDDPVGFVEIITGGGGAGLYPFLPPDQFQTWSAAWAQRHHYTLFEVDGETIRYKAIATDDNPGVFDEWVLNPAG